MLTLLLDKETRIQADPLGKLRLLAASRVPAREGGDALGGYCQCFDVKGQKVGIGTRPWSPAAAFCAGCQSMQVRLIH